MNGIAFNGKPKATLVRTTVTPQTVGRLMRRDCARMENRAAHATIVTKGAKLVTVLLFVPKGLKSIARGVSLVLTHIFWVAMSAGVCVAAMQS